MHQYTVNMKHRSTGAKEWYFKDGIFPNELELARVVPIFKCGDSTAPSNYRPS